MRNVAYVVVFGFLIGLLLFFSCEKGEVLDPIPPREVNLDVIGHEEGDFTCWDLDVIDADPILFTELFCGTENFVSAASCDDFALWLITSMEDLNKKIGDGWTEADCNVDFQSEMVIGICANKPCSGNLTTCDAKSLDDQNLIRLLQPYYCSEDQQDPLLANTFLVVPRTRRNLTVEIHRYRTEEEPEGSSQTGQD